MKLDPITQYILEKENIDEGIGSWAAGKAAQAAEYTGQAVGQMGKEFVASDPVQSTLSTAKTTGKVAAVIAVAVLVAWIIKNAIKIYKERLTVAGKKCKASSVTKGAYTQCMKIEKINAEKVKLAAMSKASGKCNKTNNPTACKEELNKMMRKQKIKIIKLEHSKTETER